MGATGTFDLRRWLPSIGVFLLVQACAFLWIVAEIHPTRVAGTMAHVLGGPLNLLTRLDRLLRHADSARDAAMLVALCAIALLPWAHVWWPRRAMLLLGAAGSVLWAASGFGFSIDHM